MQNKDLNQKLYERLLDVVGTEDDIRSRQDIFKYMDIVNGFGDSDSISISGGSLPEGIDLKGSDEDIMLVLKNIDVVPVDEDIQHKEGVVNVNMQLDTVRHGYASLFLSEEEEHFVNNSENTERTEVLNIKRSIQTSGSQCIVASSRFRGQFIRPGSASHGPCISDGDFDFAISLHGSVWPRSAKQRITACKSKRWISTELADDLVSEGCIYVPVGPRHYYYGTLWRISFAKSEKRLIMSMNHSQLLCYGLLKIVLKEGIAKQLPKNDTICSYFLKTCLFWLIEETDNDGDIWNTNRLYHCYIMCLDKLMEWVQTCNCPNYIIPGNNMFFGKIKEDNKSNILKVLSAFKDGGYDVLSQCESLGSFMTTRKLSAAEREAKLDLLCFRVLHIYPFDDTDLLMSALTVMENEYKAQTHHFTKGVISGLLSSLHQERAQMVRPSENDENFQRLLQVQREHLRKGCRSDKLCGLILLASFHHTNGFHYTAIEILNTVTETLLKSDSGLLLRRQTEYTEEEIYIYTTNFCGRGHTLEKKLEDATVRNIIFLDNSPIVPNEFQPEVHNYRPLILAPPVVYAYALKYLCHHHVNDKQKAQEALTMLDHIIDTRFLITNRNYSGAYTFVGACYETDGDYEKAKQYYEMAMKCKDICQSASYRLQRLKTHHEC